MQRSCDLMLGVPFNIASYGLLLSLLCKESGLKPGNLTGVLVDCHIYENHILAAKEQCKRELEGYRTLPNLTIYDKSSLYQESYFDIFEWTHEDILLENYNPHPKLEMEIAI